MTQTNHYLWTLPADGSTAWGVPIRSFITNLDSILNAVEVKVGITEAGLVTALANSALALAAKDGEIVAYWQPDAPTFAQPGDFWFKEIGGVYFANEIYEWTTHWVTSTSRIAQALLATHTVGGLVDGKSKIWYQPEAPFGLTSADEGDMWVDTNDNNTVYVFNGTSWILAQDSFAAQEAANKANADLADIASDGKLTDSEKITVKMWWSSASSEHSDLLTRTIDCGLTSSDYADYNKAYLILAATTVTHTLDVAPFTITHPLAWNETGTITLANLDPITTIPGVVAPYPTFQSRWSTYWSEKTKLQNKITGKVNADLSTLNEDLLKIGADGRLSASEKNIVQSWWVNATGEHADLTAKAILHNVDDSVYNNKYEILGQTTLMVDGVLKLIWDIPGTTDLTTTTLPEAHNSAGEIIIPKPSFYERWSGYWSERVKLQNTISDKIRTDLVVTHGLLINILSDNKLTNDERRQLKTWMTAVNNEFPKLKVEVQYRYGLTNASLIIAYPADFQTYSASYDKLILVSNLWSSTIVDYVETLTNPLISGIPSGVTLYDLWCSYWDNKIIVQNSLGRLAWDNALNAIRLAGLAQDIADGLIISYYSSVAPTAVNSDPDPSEGDIWFDTSDNYAIHTYKTNAWVSTPTYALAQAILAARLAGNSANNALNPDLLTANEKPTMLAWWTTAAAEKIDLIGSDNISGKAGALNTYKAGTVSTAAYLAAYNAIDALKYLGVHIWDAAGDINISAMSPYTVWSTYWSAKATLTSDIANVTWSTTTNALAAGTSNIKATIGTVKPVAGMVYGDMFFDTTPGTMTTDTVNGVSVSMPVIWTYEYNASKVLVWVQTQTSILARSIWFAQNAQGTADGKAKVWYQNDEPAGMTSNDVGDIWVDTNDNMKVYCYNGSGWVLAQDWYSANTLANDQKNRLDDIAADGKLTDNEKIIMKAWWVTAQAEYADLVSKAGILNGVTPGTIVLTNLNNAYDALNLTATKNLWLNAGTVDISALNPTLYTLWSTFWTERTKIQNTITNATWAKSVQAIADAATAQAAADGNIKSFFQTTAPTVGMSYGDIWFDTDDGNKIYTYYTSGGWTLTPTSTVALAVLAAQNAQGTADGKAKIWYQPTSPGALTVGDTGDLWVDTDDNMKVWAFDFNQIGTNNGWILAQDWYAANTLANTQKSRLDDIANDNLLTDGEKITLKSWWKTAQDEKVDLVGSDGISGRAGVLNTATPGTISLTSYNTAYNNLSSIVTKWDGTIASPTNIADVVTPSFYDRWSNLWTETTKLQNAITNATWNKSVTALSTATASQAAIDGNIKSFFQTSAPVSGMSYGDIWFDTDDSNKIYTYINTTWTLTPNSAIAKGILAAQNAQTTADGKAVVFYSPTAPSGADQGDIWVNTSDNNKVYVYPYPSSDNGHASTVAANWVIASDWYTTNQNNLQLSNIASDGQLTPGEKLIVIAWWNTIYGVNGTASSYAGYTDGEYHSLYSQSHAIDPTNALAATYKTKFDALNTPAFKGLWATQTTTTPISNDATTGFYAIWSNYWKAKTDLQNAIVNSVNNVTSNKTTTFFQNDTPTALRSGDIWIKLSAPYDIKVWNGAAWVLVQDWTTYNAKFITLDNLANDGKLTKSEQPTIAGWWNTVYGFTGASTPRATTPSITYLADGELATLFNQADALNATTAGTVTAAQFNVVAAAYDNLYSIKTKWDGSQDPAIISGLTPSFYDRWSTYWSEKSKLQNSLNTTIWNKAVKGVSDAAAALAAADGNIKTYFASSSSGLTGMSYGDIWFDITSGHSWLDGPTGITIPNIYIYDATKSPVWTSTNDSAIARSIYLAQNAQTTADGKAEVFYSNGEPTKAYQGDIWVHTDDNNKVYVCKADYTTFAGTFDSRWILAADWYTANADSALLNGLTNDNKLSPTEKTTLNTLWNAIYGTSNPSSPTTTSGATYLLDGEVASLISQANNVDPTAFASSAFKTAYIALYGQNALWTTNLLREESIVGSTFNALWTEYSKQKAKFQSDLTVSVWTKALNAFNAASVSKAAADGNIASYFFAANPVSYTTITTPTVNGILTYIGTLSGIPSQSPSSIIANYGDIFFDTTTSITSPTIYTFNNEIGPNPSLLTNKGWVATPTSALAQAILAATNALSRADGKSKIYYLATASGPNTTTWTAFYNGDMWVVTDDNYKIYVYNNATNTNRTTGTYPTKTLASAGWILAQDWQTANLNATQALAELGLIAADGIISAVEKPGEIHRYRTAQTEYNLIKAQCDSYGVPYAEFASAWGSLNSYYNTLKTNTTEIVVAGTSYYVGFFDKLYNNTPTLVKILVPDTTSALPTYVPLTNPDLSYWSSLQYAKYQDTVINGFEYWDKWYVYQTAKTNINSILQGLIKVIYAVCDVAETVPVPVDATFDGAPTAPSGSIILLRNQANAGLYSFVSTIGSPVAIDNLFSENNSSISSNSDSEEQAFMMFGGCVGTGVTGTLKLNFSGSFTAQPYGTYGRITAEWSKDNGTTWSNNWNGTLATYVPSGGLSFNASLEVGLTNVDQRKLLVRITGSGGSHKIGSGSIANWYFLYFPVTINISASSGSTGVRFNSTAASASNLLTYIGPVKVGDTFLVTDGVTYGGKSIYIKTVTTSLVTLDPPEGTYSIYEPTLKNPGANALTTNADYVLSYNSTTNKKGWKAPVASTGGTVTSIAITTANGFSGSLIAPVSPTVPSLTIALNSLTGILYGGGSNIAVATSNQIQTAIGSNVYLAVGSYTANDVLAKLITVDGTGSSLDADLLDGNHASAFAASIHTHSYQPTGNYVTTDTTQTISAQKTITGKLRMQSDLGLDAGVTLFFGKEEGFSGSDIGGSDWGYITYDNNSTKYGSGGGETSVLRIGSSNDAAGSVSDSIAIEPAADIYLNPGSELYKGTYATKYVIFHEGNYTSYVPSKTGTGASGTWSITAANATNARYIYDNGAYSGAAAYREASSMYVYYSYLGRLVYDDGTYTGNGTAAGWKESSQLGVRYAAYSGGADWAGVSNKPSAIIPIRFFYEAWVEVGDKQPLYRIAKASTLVAAAYYIEATSVSGSCQINISCNGTTLVSVVNPGAINQWVPLTLLATGLPLGGTIIANVVSASTGNVITNLTIQLDISQGL